MNAVNVALEKSREFWAKIARENGWYVEPFYVQVWVDSEGCIIDSISHQGMMHDTVITKDAALIVSKDRR